MRAPTPRLSSWLAAPLLAVVFVACGRAPRAQSVGSGPDGGREDGVFPVVLQDDRGATVTIRAEPRRIVALLPSHTETLFALGVGARVVGVDDYSTYPPETSQLPKLGGLYDTRLEFLLSLEPDLVILSETNAAATAIERSGVTVWAGSARSFDSVFEVIEKIGRMVGRTAEAKMLKARIAADMAGVEGRLRELEPVGVYYELDANLYSVGPSSFIGVMLAKAGGRNIVPAGLGDFPKISPEAVITGNPAIILGASLEEVSLRPGWSTIAAVRTGHVYKLPRPESQLVFHSGPRIADGLRVLARRLHPELAL